MVLAIFGNRYAIWLPLMRLDRPNTHSQSKLQVQMLAQTGDWSGYQELCEHPITSIRDSQYIQGLKVQFIQNALSLSEAFARQAIRAAQHGSFEAAGRAHAACGRFCQEALELIGILGNPKKARVLAAKVQTVA